jgi:uncharacterized protein YndB with AHSA1/START domain
MPFQPDPQVISWRLHLRSSPAEVYDMLSTTTGRERFWAESAPERDGAIHFVFPGGEKWQGRILEASPPHRYQVEYYGGSLTTFDLAEDEQGGTELTLTDLGVDPQDRAEVIAGWVSVLMALKAAVDHGVDLRNHQRDRSWAEGYVEN